MLPLLVTEINCMSLFDLSMNWLACNVIFPLSGVCLMALDNRLNSILCRFSLVTLQTVYLFKADVSFFHQVGKVGYCCIQELAEVELRVIER